MQFMLANKFFDRYHWSLKCVSFRMQYFFRSPVACCNDQDAVLIFLDGGLGKMIHHMYR